MGRRLRNDLDRGGAVPARLVRRFARHGIQLDGGAMVSVTAPGEAWSIINDPSGNFDLIRDQKRLSVGRPTKETIEISRHADSYAVLAWRVFTKDYNSAPTQDCSAL